MIARMIISVFNFVKRLIKNVLLILMLALLAPIIIALIPHFRQGRKHTNAGHPVWVFNEKEGKYEYVSLTHDSKYGNKKLENNPNPKDAKPTYIHPKSYTANKNAFHQEEVKGWNDLTDKDKELIKNLPKTNLTPNQEYRAAKKNGKKD
ncbi:MAG: hypothetical protein FWB72_03935 [Firmicutes bacterium]|nr:hypothetical protein [Bacillota bacterium]